MGEWRKGNAFMTNRRNKLPLATWMQARYRQRLCAVNSYIPIRATHTWWNSRLTMTRGCRLAVSVRWYTSQTSVLVHHSSTISSSYANITKSSSSSGCPTNLACHTISQTRPSKWCRPLTSRNQKAECPHHQTCKACNHQMYIRHRKRTRARTVYFIRVDWKKVIKSRTPRS